MGKKVVLLGPAHPFRGGIADTQNDLAINLQKLGHDIKAYTFTTQYPRLLFPGETQFSDAQAPQNIDIERKIHSYNPFNWSKVAESINRLSPDFVIFRYWTPFLAPCWYGIARGLNKSIKKIGLVDNWIPHETRAWDKTLTRIFSRQMNGMATLSMAVGDQITEDQPNTPVWRGFHPIADNLPTIIDKRTAREDLGWPLDKKIVLFFGLIRKYKGLDLLIRAFAESPLNRSDVILAIVGEVYESKNKYNQLIQKLKLDERIICDFNYAESQKASKIFCAADVIAQTYTSATQSGVTPLAYHYQTPVLVSDLPGLKSPIINDKTGEITEINPKKIAEKLTFMLQDKILLEYQSNFKTAIKQYSWKSFSQYLLHFIEQL
ncbi:MAG: glycosyltransferase [Flavobacteriaceae bacterium]